MAFSLVSDSRRRDPFGTRWVVRCIVDDVTSSGDNITAATLGLSAIEHVVVQAEDATVAVQATPNSTNGSDSSAGSLYLKSASTTTDVHVLAVGRG